MNYIYKHLWLKIILIAFSITTIVICSLVASLVIKNNSLLDEIFLKQSNELADAVYLGFYEAISSGKNEDVTRQFDNLKSQMPENKIEIFDFNGVITFSSDDSTGKSIYNHVFSSEESNAIKELVETGSLTSNHFLDKNTYMLAIYRPILNEKKCHHCHGSTRNVLGGMQIHVPTAEIHKKISWTGRLSFLYGFLGIAVLLLVLYFFIQKYVSAPLNSLVFSLKDIAQGEGDLTKKIDVSTQDEIGQVSYWFNQFLDNLKTIIAGIKKDSEILYESAFNISTAMEEMSATSQEIASAVVETEEAMGTSSQSIITIAERIKTQESHVGDMVGQFGEVEEKSDHGVESVFTSVRAMESIKSHSERIVEMISMINSISKQTNLLSLNAAIEAASAGRHGKGFAVVAEEVRILAEKTDQASKQITEIITESNSEVVSANNVIQSAGSALSEISEKIKQLGVVLDEISHTSKDQISNIDEITGAIDQVSNLSSQNASATTELTETVADITRTATTLAGISENLKEQMNRFKT